MEEHRFKYLHDFRNRLWLIVFGTDTPAGKRFDVVLLWVILASIILVMIESVKSINDIHGDLFTKLEWFFTMFFTAEYIMRLWIARRPWRYAFSFYGLVDLLAVIPTYLTLFYVGGTYLVVIRVVRLLRVFRILKLTRQLGEAQMLGRALMASRHKILVFLGGVLALVIIMGTLMYLIEGGENGFDSIPRSIYWAIVTITTVGYGDIAPGTVIGQAFAAVLMLMGYAIIAVPTGIVTSELTFAQMDAKNRRVSCAHCGNKELPENARYCSNCGEEI